MTHRLPETPEFLATALRFKPGPNQREVAHLFDLESVLAVNTALALGRPLLVRGDPGVGKSQLALAAAWVLRRPFLSVFVNAHTQVQDLLWHEDLVTRLAEAQTFKVEQGSAADHLAREWFVRPGPLWWALNWTEAAKHGAKPRVKVPAPGFDETECNPLENGVVLLIDEIDKADSSVPNGLLEVLGQSTFSVPGFPEPVRASEPAPLIVLTTNEDRTLPDAFVRRCVVLHLRLPDWRRWPDEFGERSLAEWLAARGRAHFPELDEQVLQLAAKQVQRDREFVQSAGFCAPGLAEYINLLEAAIDVGGGVEGAMARIEAVARFVLHKHADPGPMKSKAP
ncbi:AAA family ATPase [Nannocystaceae bacterium ST9]